MQLFNDSNNSSKILVITSTQKLYFIFQWCDSNQFKCQIGNRNMHPVQQGWNRIPVADIIENVKMKAIMY